MARRYYILRDGARLYRDTLQEISTLARKTANATGEAVKVMFEEVDVFGRAGRKGAAVRHAPRKMVRNPARNVHGKKFTYTVFQWPGSKDWEYQLKYAGKIVGKQSGYSTESKARKAAIALSVKLENEGYLPKRQNKNLLYKRNPDPADLADHTLRMIRERQRQQTAKVENQKFTIFARGRKPDDTYKLTRKGAAKARALAREFQEAGYQVTVTASNPAKRKNPTTKASKARKKAAHKRGCYVEYKAGAKLERQKFANRGLAQIAANEMKRSGFTRVRVIGA